MLQTKLAEQLIKRNQTLCTVESCTGGGIASLCTDLPGSSRWFVGAVVTYANSMKISLGVESILLDQYGAVSEEVVLSMAKNGLKYCGSDWSIAVSGVAGPDGGSAEKPVGTVWFAWANNEHSWTERLIIKGSRADVRLKAAHHGIIKLIEFLN